MNNISNNCKFYSNIIGRCRTRLGQKKTHKPLTSIIEVDSDSTITEEISGRSTEQEVSQWWCRGQLLVALIHYYSLFVSISSPHVTSSISLLIIHTNTGLLNPLTTCPSRIIKHANNHHFYHFTFNYIAFLSKKFNAIYL